MIFLRYFVQGGSYTVLQIKIGQCELDSSITAFIKFLQFQYAKNQLIAIDQQMREMEKLRLDLAIFFCEDPQTFKLEDCFKIFYNFCIQFNKAIEENNERKIREEKSEMRKKQLKEQQKSKAKGN